MATIRKQAIISGVLMYVGFAVGALNVYLFTHFFHPQQYGLTRSYMDFGQTMFAFGSFGAVSVLYKFSPYYISNLSPKRNDLLTWVLCLAIIGFALVSIAGYVFEPYVIRKFSNKSPLFLQYYYWVFPFGFGILLFGILEAFSLSLKKAVLPTFFKEIALRLLTSCLIGLYLLKLISFPTFIYLFSFTYLGIAIMLLLMLIKQNNIHLHFSVSKVSLRLWKKMLAMQGYFYAGTIILILKDTIDGILINGLIGLEALGVFALAQYVASLIQAPQRSMLNVSVGIISQAWKDKNFAEINRVYTRSCINMFIMSAFMYGNVVLNTEEAIHVFSLNPLYLQGIQAMIVLGFMRVIDAGTGVNNIVIQTSNRWRFDFYSGIILLALILPLNYFLIKKYGIIGSAYAQLISFVIYNIIRFEFIRRQFKMQPFSSKTVYSILLAALAFVLAYFIGTYFQGLAGILLRSIIFSGLMISGVFAFNLTPDAWQLWEKFMSKRK